MISAKDQSVFLPLETESAILTSQRVLFGVSCLLHVPAVFCLMRETPSHQAHIKPLLVVLQICIIVSDLFFSTLFEPIPVIEAIAGYCKGLLCHVVLPPVVLGLYVFVVAVLAISSLTCGIARHQVMMPSSSSFKLRKRTIIAGITILVLAFFIPTTMFIVYPFNKLESDRLINESRFEIAWIRERGPYFVVPDTPFIHVILWCLFTCCILFLVAALAPFCHMLYVLSAQTNKSERSKMLIRRSLQRLFIQVNVPYLLVDVPLTILCIQAEFHCFPFLVTVVGMSAIALHPIAHNLVLLLLMPTYRRVITQALTRIRLGRQPKRWNAFLHSTRVAPSRASMWPSETERRS